MPSGNSRSIKKLTTGEVLFVHNPGIDIVFEGYSSPSESRGVRGHGELLNSALYRPFHTYDGKDLYPDLFLKAAALLHGLANNHPFVDGNKRTALLSALTFLMMNGFDINATESQLVRLMRGTARGKRIPSIALWLKQHSVDLYKDKYPRPKDVAFLGRRITFLRGFTKALKTRKLNGR